MTSNAQQQHCIDACRACADACERCALACRKDDAGNALLSRACTRATDCADFCRLTASFLGRDSEFSDLVREDCAELCQRCAEECGQQSLPECRQCAEACRTCAELCLAMQPEGA